MKSFTPRFLVIGFFLTLCFSYSSNAQNVVETQTVIGHLVRTTPKLADLDRTSMYGKPFVITRNMDGIIGGIERRVEEAEEKIERKLARANQNKVTQGIQNPNTIFPNTPGTSIGVNFNGQTSPGLQPSDNNMAAGPNHIIQIVNNVSGSQFTIWNKSGTVVQGPTILSSLTGFPGLGDPVVLYDQLADRWVLSEFGPGGTTQNWLVMAVSVTPNPTGAWKIYQFLDNSFFPDYPKYSVWHNAYYATTNDFSVPGQAYLGSSVWSFDRTAMLAGAATATMIRTRQNNAGSNFYNEGTIGLEGMTPSTQNGLFAYPVGPTTLNVYEVTPNFGAGTQTIGPTTAIPIAAYVTPPNAVSQQGGGTTIGTLGERMMFKLNYRNNAGTESIVITHTVGNGSGGAAVRWYELRRIAGIWTLFQQGTIAGADGNNRWMGGISMDGCGNIALMYDVSGPTSFPSVKYTGRNASDPLGTMTLPEQTIVNGGVAFGGTRWGDYNTTVQDYSSAGNPTNGSFWSTSQYANQLTRVANYTLTGGCAAAPNIVTAGSTITAESCAPANGVIDAGETVTVNFCLQNVGTLNTTNLVATLLPTGSVVTPSGPQTYGVLTAGGASVCKSFTFSNSAICGGTITATLQLQDGATNLGTVTYTFTVGNLVTTTLLSENFDGVGAPALPAGWVATQGVNLAGAPLWVTATGTTVSAPNSIFSPDPSNVLDNLIETPTIAIPAGPGTKQISFQNNFNTENTFDGGVLEISINGGAYADITVGGAFTAGGYNNTISTAFSSPIAGRQAWSGSSGGYITSTATLPAAATGQNVKFRFRMASDVSVASTGWNVDNVTVTNAGFVCCGIAPPCIITCPANITTSNTANQCGAVVNYPAPTTSGACGTVTSTPASGSFFPVGTTTVTATSQSGASCQFTVTVNDTQAPTITCPGNQTRSTNNNVCTYTTVGTEFNATATDNCPGAITFAYTLTGATTGTGSTLAGVVFNKGITNVSWTAKDGVNNTSAPCTFTVTVNDNQNPVITCPANSTVTTPIGSCTAIVNYTVTASDNCPGVVTSLVSGLASGSAFPIGVNTVSWKATDASGNISTCSFTVTVLDGQLPVITTQPVNKFACVGTNATFSVVATNVVTYQWQAFNGSTWNNITGANASSYTINSVTLAMNTNSYRVVINGLCTTGIISGYASLYVNPLPTVSLTTSRPAALTPGQSLDITAVVSPTGGSFVWYKNGVVIAGATGGALTGLTVDNIGTYKVVYTDLNGCVSTSADLVVSGQASDKLWVYPNPNRGIFQVRFYNAVNEPVTVTIYDSKGAKVYSNAVITTIPYTRIDVDLTGAKSEGTYLVEVVNSAGKKVGAKKFVMYHP